MQLPFQKYALCQVDGRLNLLGRGGSAEVFEAQTRSSKKRNYAMKVIGFRNQHANSNIFKESVEMQKEMADFQDNVVKIYDFTEIWINLDEKDNVVSAVKEKPAEILRSTIKLQFILMEKIPSVISRSKGDIISMIPEQLAYGDEQEIIKLAYDIGLALERAHDKKILHRDVKLENVFYSEKKNQYKLGDFGIAKKTEEGFADTVAFKNGYAAPEVRCSDDRYDNTADIYSFGMMLYVLANGLRFPDSDTYNVNSDTQYTPGYVVPYPESDISYELYSIIAKACMYDSDQRYQSMKEMIRDLDNLRSGRSLGYKKEHKNSSLVIGMIMLALGVITWKLTMAPEMIIFMSFWEYVFWGACFGKGVQKIYKKDVSLLSCIILGIGMYLLIKSGFSWVKLLFLLWMTFSTGTSSCFLATSVFIAQFTYLAQNAYGMDLSVSSEYSWLAVTTISISVIMFVQYELLIHKNQIITEIFFKKGLYWIAACLFYIECVMLGFTMDSVSYSITRRILGETIWNFLHSFDLGRAGLVGLCFCLFWIAREKILILLEDYLQYMDEENETDYDE